MSNYNNHTHQHPSLLLTLLHPYCQQGYHGNSSVSGANPQGDASRKKWSGVEGDTDFGAVMYISAVLIFYSLGIVVMIVKYLRTERKDIEEELMVENFVKGIPSKKMEHEQEAVNRVAIRAFHTLTSRTPRQEQTTRSTEPSVAETEGDTDSLGVVNQDGGDSPEDSDCATREDSSFRLLRHHRSKHLPRVSLMFRHSRSSHCHRPQNGRHDKTSSLKPDKQPRGDQPISLSFLNQTEKDQMTSYLGDTNNFCDHMDDANGSNVNPAVEERFKQASHQGTCDEFQNENTKVRFQDERSIGQQSASHVGKRIKTGTKNTLTGAKTKTETPFVSALSNTVTDGQEVISQTTTPAGDTGQVDGSVGNMTALLVDRASQNSPQCDRDINHSVSSIGVQIDCFTGPRHVLESDV
ncbi:hypothetical protein ACOMHN_014962 [Nucella lapillus]